MSSSHHSEGNLAVAALVSAALLELVDAMSALSARVKHCSDPFEQDEYDRLALLFPAMLDGAEDLCRAADGLLANAAPMAVHETHSATPYAELIQSLAQARELARLVLKPLRPQVHEHADAVALINRVSAGSSSVRGKSC